MGFFSKDESTITKAEWTIGNEHLINNYTNIRYSKLELFAAHVSEVGMTTFWFRRKFLVTLKCSAKVMFEFEPKLRIEEKYYIPVNFSFEAYDVNENKWILDDFHLCSEEQKLSVYCLRFVQSGDNISVYKYGRFITKLISDDLVTLNGAKNSIIRQGCLRLDESIDKHSAKAEYDRRNIELSNISDALLQQIIITTETVAPFEVDRRIDIITAECAFGMNIIKDLFTGLTDVFGGRSSSIQNTLRDAKENVLRELRREAYRVGANAVIGVDLDYSEFSGGGKSMLFVVASGTAIKANIK